MARTKQAPKKSTDGKSTNPALKGVPKKKPAATGPSNGKIVARKDAPGAAMVREMEKLQLITTNIIPRAPFVRLVREIVQGFDDTMRVQNSAVVALQEASESYLTDLFTDVELLAVHAKRKTILKKDMELAVRIRGGKR